MSLEFRLVSGAVSDRIFHITSVCVVVLFTVWIAAALVVHSNGALIMAVSIPFVYAIFAAILSFWSMFSSSRMEKLNREIVEMAYEMFEGFPHGKAGLRTYDFGHLDDVAFLQKPLGDGSYGHFHLNGSRSLYFFIAISVKKPDTHNGIISVRLLIDNEWNETHIKMRTVKQVKKEIEHLLSEHLDLLILEVI